VLDNQIKKTNQPITAQIKNIVDKLELAYAMRLVKVPYLVEHIFLGSVTETLAENVMAIDTLIGTPPRGYDIRMLGIATTHVFDSGKLGYQIS